MEFNKQNTMKRTRFKFTKDEAISVVIGEDKNVLFLDIIDKEDIAALDEHYVEEFGSKRILPFVMNPDQFNMVIRHGMVPMMEMIVEDITGAEISKAMEFTDEELDQAILSKVKFNVDKDKSVN
jgi:hypothetical protein